MKMRHVLLLTALMLAFIGVIEWLGSAIVARYIFIFLITYFSLLIRSDQEAIEHDLTLIIDAVEEFVGMRGEKIDAKSE